MPLKEIHLKRKNREKFIHIPLDVLYPIFLPSPNLRRYIIINRNICMLLHKFGNLQIKSWIIYQNYHIRIPIYDILLAKLHILENGAQMQKHWNKTHISQFFIMLNTGSSYSTHQIPTKETEISIHILLLQGTHQIGRMQISRSFTNNQIILHTSKFQVFNSLINP